MRAPDPAAKLRELLSRPLVKVCGLTREEDVAAAVEAGADLAGFILAEESPRRATRVLDVPDTVLSVAVFVGEVEETRRRPRPALRARERPPRAATRVLLRDGERVATVIDLPWAAAGSDAPRARACATEGRVDARRRPRAGQRARGDRRASSPWAVDASSRLEVEPGVKDPRRACARSWRRRDDRDATARYGGRYVPETLIPALDELEAGWRDAQADPAFAAELDELGARRTPAGRRRSRSPSASRPASASTSSARTSCTPARTS